MKAVPKKSKAVVLQACLDEIQLEATKIPDCPKALSERISELAEILTSLDHLPPEEQDHDHPQATQDASQKGDGLQAEGQICYQARLLEYVSDAVVLTDQQFRIVTWNQAAERLYDWNGKEVLGKVFSEVVPVEYPHTNQEAAVAEFRKTGHWQGDAIQYKKNGDRLYVRSSVTKIAGQSGEFVGAIAVNRDITDYRQMEENLSQLNERFALAVRAAHLGVWDWDIQNNILVWDDQMYALYGVNRQDFSGAYDTWLNGLHPDDRAASDDVSLQARCGEREYDTEFRVIWPDGSIHVLKAYGQVLFDEDGTARRMLGVNFDITEQKQAEVALLQNEERLRSILDATPFPIALVDDQDDIIDYWSRSALDLFGHTASIVSEWYRIAYPDPEYRQDVIARWKPFVKQARSSGQTVNTGEYRVTCSDGSVRVCELFATIIFDRLVVTFNDITERVQAEEALRESHIMFSLFLKYSPIYAFIKQVSPTESRVLRASENYQDMVGIPGSKMAGKTMEELFPPEFAAKITADDWAVVAGGEVLVLDEILNERTYTTFKFPIAVSGTNLLAGYTIDITERVKAQEDLKDYSERLEEMVAERTLALGQAQEALVKREKLAVLGQLAGGVGHELRNPLGVIKNAVYYLKMILASPGREVSETLDLLTQEVEKSEQIITDLLDFARTKPPTRREVGVNDVLQESLSNIPVPDNIRVVSQLADNLPHILADPIQLDQVFSNIIRNSLQAMPEGGQLRIETRMESPAWLSIAFTDSGVGICDENKPHIFEPLFTTKAKGIGLGLAIVKNLVESHGGTVTASSSGVPGEGSSFTLRLPLEYESDET